jgi:hypothetical protein
MNVNSGYTQTSGTDIQVQAGGFPFDFSDYANPILYSSTVKKLFAVSLLAHELNYNRSNFRYFPLLQYAPATKCANNSMCSEAVRLIPQFVFDETVILGVTNISQYGFITIYRLPFYHIRVISGTTWPFSGNLNCHSYGYQTQIGATICAKRTETDRGPMIVLDTIQLRVH